ncbi:MAG: saccharopine dehydrogenase [Phormidesmis sp. RL_2_1]|nr:saccharopine dehydrogenase [Phormidesmis sp. RL_2_1]
MTQSVLVIGGGGRIGRQVAADILTYTAAEVVITGRRAATVVAELPDDKLTNDKLADDKLADDKLADERLSRQRYQVLALEEMAAVERAIAQHDLIVHCAGPFRSRNHHVLASCIAQGKPYLDVADSPDYVNQALTYRQAAQAAGVTAVISTGIFPGISGSMVRQGIEQLDTAESVHLSYLVAGSGGAGVTVMRTTFIELQTPFMSKIQGKWRAIAPYSQREVLTFPRYGKGGVYWFNTVEALTVADTFPQLQTIVTKFGSVPDYYNRLTGLMAKMPKAILKNPTVIEKLSQISYRMTQITDPQTGVGIAMRILIEGHKGGEPARYLATFDHEDTAFCAGCGTGALAQLLLSGKLKKPGVWPVEQILPTELFEATLAQRKLTVELVQ